MKNVQKIPTQISDKMRVKCSTFPRIKNLRTYDFHQPAKDPSGGLGPIPPPSFHLELGKLSVAFFFLILFIIFIILNLFFF